MEFIETLEDLEALYGTPSNTAMVKVADHLTPCYEKWISASRFCILSTVGPEGTDATPRGDAGPVVKILDSKHLALPDWRGNQRLDNLRNIVRDGRVSLMFMVPGANEVIRVNGHAKITTDETLCAEFEQAGKHPATVCVIQIGEVYSQCARAILRSRLWSSGDESHDLPTVGDIIKEMSKGEIDGAAYDKAWPARAVASLW
jgi:PPOX class probable FMN-dependent enzyme